VVPDAGSRLEASAREVRPVFTSPKLHAKELESLSERIRDGRDELLEQGGMSAAPWYGLFRDYMWALAVGDVQNTQVGCSACYGPLPEDEVNTAECPYCASMRSEWPVQAGVPTEVLQMYVQAATRGKRAQRFAVARSLLVVVAISGFLMLIGVWPLAVLALLGGGLVTLARGGSAQRSASVPYFVEVWGAHLRQRNT
jgi:hypothetical protein